MQSQNRQNDLCLFPSKPFNITIIQVYAITSNAEEAEVEWFYEDLKDLLELTLKKRCPFHYRRASLVAQRLKRLPPMRETRVRSLG